MRDNQQLITDISPIDYSPLLPPMYCLCCRELRDRWVSHNYEYNNVHFHMQTCNTPECIAKICKEIADCISNGTFTVEHFQGIEAEKVR